MSMFFRRFGLVTPPLPAVALSLIVAAAALTATAGAPPAAALGSSAATRAAVAPIPGQLFLINAGGPASNGYSADADFVGGSSYSNNSRTVTTANASFPAPVPIYQSAHEGAQFTYSFSGFTPGIRYVVILHFAELYWSTPFKRRFNVAINGTPELTDFDIVEQTGSSFNAIDEFFSVPADANGKISIVFTKGTVDQPSVNGIEIRANNG